MGIWCQRVCNRVSFVAALIVLLFWNLLFPWVHNRRVLSAFGLIKRLGKTWAMERFEKHPAPMKQIETNESVNMKY